MRRPAREREQRRDREERLATRWGRVLCVSGFCALGALVLTLGCAQTQIVPVTIQPVPVTLYIDGELHPHGSPDQLELRADRPHILFFKKEGYRSEQIVIRSLRDENGSRLEPDRVEVRLSPVTSKRRELKVELDE